MFCAPRLFEPFERSFTSFTSFFCLFRQAATNCFALTLLTILTDLNLAGLLQIDLFSSLCMSIADRYQGDADAREPNELNKRTK